MPNTMRILLVEDNGAEIASYEESLEVYKEESQNNIELIVCKNTTDASDRIDNNIDAAIVDLRLDENEGDGNSVIQLIQERLHRLPVAIYSGTPNDVNPELLTPLITKYTKGDESFVDIIDELYIFFKTGITKIFGGRGVLEETMNQIFNESIIPQTNAWKKYVEEEVNIEKALIRYTISHLHNLLDNDVEASIPEEMYINDYCIRTGSLLKNKDTGNYHVVVSPACDMVDHKGNGCYKTNRVALCEIEDHDTVINRIVGNTGRNKLPRKIETIIKNNGNNYHHWLPKSYMFDGGFINMRHLETFEVSEVKNDLISTFEMPSCVISPHFMKDVISRLSAYYARQGQPNFNFTEIAQAITDSRD